MLPFETALLEVIAITKTACSVSWEKVYEFESGITSQNT